MFRFFADQALTTPVNRLSVVTLLSAGDPEPVAAVVYFGSQDATTELSAASAGDISISVAVGGDLPASAVRLALSQAGLATALGGAALNIGSTVAGGAGGALAVWIAVDTDGAVGRYSISLRTSEVIENG